MKKKVFLLLFLATQLFSYSQNIDKYYKEIATSLVDLHYSEYKINVPDNWFSYYTDPGMVAHSPNEFKGNIKPNALSNLFIIHKKNYKSKNLDKSLKSFIRFHKDLYPGFKYKLIEAKHNLYGKYYIIKYGVKRKKGLKVIMACVFNWKQENYVIFYSSIESGFDKYLKDVIEMISSFEIIE